MVPAKPRTKAPITESSILLYRGPPIDLQWPKVWQNPTPISRRYSPAWTIILLDKGYGGVHWLSHTRMHVCAAWRGAGPRLFTQLTRLVLRIAWAPARAWAKHPHVAAHATTRRKLERSSNAREAGGAVRTYRYLSAIETDRASRKERGTRSSLIVATRNDASKSPSCWGKPWENI